jgi:D-xylose transport system permease protein
MQPEDEMSNGVNVYGVNQVLKNIKMNIRSYTMIIALLIIWVIMAILTKGTFFTPRNMSMLVRQSSITGVLSIGMLMVIITGNIDLSAGSVLGLLGGIAACTQVWYEFSTVQSIFMVALFGILIGAWHGFCVAYLRVPAFIATLGGYLAFRGVLIGLTKSVTIAPMSPTFKAIGQSYLPNSIGWTIAFVLCVICVIGVFRGRQAKIKYGFDVPNIFITMVNCVGIIAIIGIFMWVMAQYQGIPNPVVILLCLAAVFWFITTKTRFGRSIYAIGCNQEAARLAGIDTKKIVFIVYILMGILAGVAGIILTARLNAGTVSAGNMAEMDAIAACVIGGASLSGGAGAIPSAIVGALVMASLDNGMSLMNTENFWQYIIKGAILIFAVWLDITTKRKTS